MPVPTSLHTLVFSPLALPSSRTIDVLREFFPDSRFMTVRKVDRALGVLAETPFDLVVLILDGFGPRQAEILEGLRNPPRPVPVVILLPAAKEERFHKIVDGIDPDWSILIHEHASDQALIHAVRLAIERCDLRWRHDHLERALENSLVENRNLLDQVPDVIFTCDRGGCLHRVNATAARVFGVGTEKMILNPIFDTFGLAKEVFDDLVRVATDVKGPIKDVEIEFHPPSGQVIYGLTHMIPLLRAPGRPVRFQGVIKDITLHKELETRLRGSEVKHKTLYDLAQISSGSLDLEEVSQRSLRLITARCAALGSLLLFNQRYDELNVLASGGVAAKFLSAFERDPAAKIGHGVVGRWSISGRLQWLDSDGFEQLHPHLRAWLESIGAHCLLGCPLGHTNPTLPAAVLIFAFNRATAEKFDEDLLAAMAKTFEMGVNNCYHYSCQQKAESKYRELWQNAPAYLFQLIKGGVIIECNLTAVRALGYKLSDMIGRPLTDFIHPEDRPRFDENHRRLIEQGEEQTYELRLLKAGGETLIARVKSSPLLDEEGSIIGEKADLYDITRDKMLEAGLRDQAEILERSVSERTHELTRTMNFLNAILEGSTEFAIFGLDEKGLFVHFNRGAQFILHYAPEEMVRERALDHLIDFGAAGTDGLAALLDEVDRRSVLVREVEMKTGEGHTITAIMSLNRLAGASGEELAYVGIARDITDEKAMREELNRSKDRLEHEVDLKTEELNQRHIELIQSSKLATLGEMATGIAHELNQPLSGIRTRAQLLAKVFQKGRSRPEKVIDTQKQIMELVDRISRIIEHMRVFSRQDQEPFGPFDVNQSIEGCMNLLGEQLRLHAIEVDIELPPDPLRIKGEPSQIEQVLLNLVGNARDALDEKEDRLRADGANGAEPFRKRISIRLARAADTEVCLSVSDNGEGMSDEARQRVFQPFFTTKPVGRGTGLGLSISYGIVSRHHGRIDVETRVGEGTTFHLYFPVYAGGDESGAASGARGRDPR